MSPLKTAGITRLVEAPATGPAVRESAETRTEPLASSEASRPALAAELAGPVLQRFTLPPEVLAQIEPAPNDPGAETKVDTAPPQAAAEPAAAPTDPDAPALPAQDPTAQWACLVQQASLPVVQLLPAAPVRSTAADGSDDAQTPSPGAPRVMDLVRTWNVAPPDSSGVPMQMPEQRAAEPAVAADPKMADVVQDGPPQADAVPSKSTAQPRPDSALNFSQVLAGLSLNNGSAGATQAASPAAPLALATDAMPNTWQQPLLQALGDRLQLQIASRSEQAVLHLAPPHLGQVEIAIRQQGGVLQVQMSATHDEVASQLRQISEPLRHELVQRHAGEVSVQVATSGGGSLEGRGREAAGQGQSQADAREQRERQARDPSRSRDEDDSPWSQDSASFAERLARTATVNG